MKENKFHKKEEGEREGRSFVSQLSGAAEVRHL